MSENEDEQSYGTTHRPSSNSISVNSIGGTKIGTWMLVGLIFFSVSGGPVGMEVSVKAGGPFLALLGFLVMPLMWSVPEAAMTAELSIAYPEAAGFAAWTNAAFGPFWSFQCSMMSYFSGVLDNAVYPVLLIQYLTQNDLFSDISDEVRWISILVFTFIMTYLTWRGLDVNGMTCIILTAFILLPFIIFSLIGIPQIEPSNWFLGPVKRDSHGHIVDDDEVQAKHNGGWNDIKWHSLINILFWNLNYFDSASAFSGDCVEPEKTFPKAMFISVFFIVLTYFIPLLVATGADPNAHYCDGCFVDIARHVAGPWLAYWITIAAAASCIGQFMAEMASDSFQIMGMADEGQLPKFLSKRSKYGTPTKGVLLSMLGIFLAAPLDFSAIIELVNILYIFAEIIEFATFIKLRTKPPIVQNAWKVPVSSPIGYLALFGPACVFLCAMLFYSSIMGMIVAASVITFSVFFYVWICAAKEFQWAEFEPTRDDWNSSKDPQWVQYLVRIFSERFQKTKTARPTKGSPQDNAQMFRQNRFYDSINDDCGESGDVMRSPLHNDHRSTANGDDDNERVE